MGREPDGASVAHLMSFSTGVMLYLSFVDITADTVASAGARDRIQLLEQQLQRLAGQRRLAARRRAPRVDGPVAGLDLEPPRRAGARSQWLWWPV